jgi:hypothetical protein
MHEMKPFPSLRLLKQSEGQVLVPAKVSRDLGFERIVVRPGLDVGAAVLLAELKGESCGHSWRGALQNVEAQDAEGLVRAVVELAAITRPTTLYTYWGQTPSGEAPIAIAAVSTHVRHGFPHAGFPVVARCVIRRCYRGYGLYPHLLRHRLELCRAFWGDELRAIHIGAADPAVLATLSGQSPNGVSFACVGVERLQVADERFWVPDFIGATPRFREDLAQELQDSDPRISSLAQKVESFLTEGASTVSYSALCETLKGVQVGHGEAWWKTCHNLKSLMDLCDAIGVQSA